MPTTRLRLRSRRWSVVCSITLSPLLSLAGELSSPPTGASSAAFPPVAPAAPFTPKVKALLVALTLDEKLSLVSSGTDPDSLGEVGYTPGVPRLGIPPRRDANALGIQVTANATALPARMGLAATFDRDIVYSIGQLEGNEGRALGVDLMYGPQTDLTRLPNWGRNNTTWGEDPVLNGNLAIAEVEGSKERALWRKSSILPCITVKTELVSVRSDPLRCQRSLTTRPPTNCI